MKKLVMLATLAIAASPAAAQQVQSADGDWSNLPRIEERGNLAIGAASLERVEKVARDKVCSVPGLAPNRVDLTIPFALQFSPSGELRRVIVKRMGCPQLDSVLGGVVLQLARSGEYKPTGSNPAGWYRSELSFATQ